jgi:hypothetical protein
MLRDFFSRFNAYLAGHPGFLAKLKLLFWIKYWALTGLMGVFLYLIYRERGWRRKTPTASRAAGHSFEA